MTTQVRLYGPAVGNGSFPRVTAGMKQGLELNFALAGFVPNDVLYDEDTRYSGFDAEVAVYVGNSTRVSMMSQIGDHKHRFFLLPPNSTWLPKQVIEYLSKYVTGFISPSTWGVEVLKKYTNLPVHLWHHGVFAEFSRSEKSLLDRTVEFDSGCFNVLHLASTSMQRKGTRELIEAWGNLVSNNRLGSNPFLQLVVDGNSDDFASVVRKFCKTPSSRESVVWVGRLNMSVHQTASAYRRHHLVCQPSRGEGFGLCPLESRACGTVAVATNTTGHSDHFLSHLYAGCVNIKSGPLDTIDDGSEALAPAVLPSEIEKSLLFAFENWPVISKSAFEESTSIHHDWSWEEVTNKWLDSYWEI